MDQKFRPASDYGQQLLTKPPYNGAMKLGAKTKITALFIATLTNIQTFDFTVVFAKKPGQPAHELKMIFLKPTEEIKQGLDALEKKEHLEQIQASSYYLKTSEKTSWLLMSDLCQNIATPQETSGPLWLEKIPLKLEKTTCEPQASCYKPCPLNFELRWARIKDNTSSANGYCVCVESHSLSKLEMVPARKLLFAGSDPETNPGGLIIHRDDGSRVPVDKLENLYVEPLETLPVRPDMSEYYLENSIKVALWERNPHTKEIHPLKGGLSGSYHLTLNPKALSLMKNIAYNTVQGPHSEDQTPIHSWIADVTPENIEKLHQIMKTLSTGLTTQESLKFLTILDPNVNVGASSVDTAQDHFLVSTRNQKSKSDSPSGLCWRYSAIGAHLAYKITAPYLPSRKGLGADLNYAKNANLVFEKMKKPNGEPAFEIIPFPDDIQKISRDDLLKSGLFKKIMGAEPAGDTYNGPILQHGDGVVWSNSKSPGHKGWYFLEDGALVEYSDHRGALNGSKRPGGRGTNKLKFIVRPLP